MTTVEPYLRKRKNQAGLCPINIRITKDRKSTYIQTGQRINSQYWDSNKKRVKKTHPNSVRLNNMISIRLAEVNKSLLKIESDARSISDVIELKNVIRGRNKSLSFYKYADSYFSELEKNHKYSRINSEKPILNRIKGYPAAKNLTFEKITPLFLRGFITHLRNSNNRIGERSIVNTLIFIRTLYNRAANDSLISREGYPFGNSRGKIKIKIPKSIKIGLTVSEIQTLEDLVLTSEPKLNHARNVFLFSFYLAGMRISDVLKMKWQNVQGERIFYTMNKNQKNLSLKIHPKLEKILNEYKPYKVSQYDYIFPDLKGVPSEPKQLLDATKAANKSINRYLKMIAEEAEISKNLTMHIARHSFGNISGDRIPLQVLQKLYNHSDIKTTIDYQQNFMNKDLDDALDNVIGF